MNPFKPHWTQMQKGGLKAALQHLPPSLIGANDADGLMPSALTSLHIWMSI
jgi:hypothetical protein